MVFGLANGRARLGLRVSDPTIKACHLNMIVVIQGAVTAAVLFPGLVSGFPESLLVSCESSPMFAGPPEFLVFSHLVVLVSDMSLPQPLTWQWWLASTWGP